MGRAKEHVGMIRRGSQTLSRERDPIHGIASGLPLRS